MSQSEKQRLHLILGLLVLLISLAVLLTSYLAYSFYKENKEYSEAVSSIQDDGYVFATEVYRLPVKEVVDKICNKSDVVFLYKNGFFSYKEMQDVEEVYIKKDFFVKLKFYASRESYLKQYT